MRTLASISCCLAAGLLVQIAVQIKLLRWLPDFPAYDALAITAGVICPFVLPLVWTARRRAPQRALFSGLLFSSVLAMFLLLAVAHAVLAARSSSTAIQAWRNLALWPALGFGMASCLMLEPARAVGRTAHFRGGLMWSLGEAFAALIAAWCAPSFGESTNLATYQYVIFQTLLTWMIVMMATLPCDFSRNLNRWRRLWPARGFMAIFRQNASLEGEPRLAADQALFIFSGVSFAIVANLTFLPAGIGPAMMTVLLVRFAIFLWLARWAIREMQQGEIPATVD